MRHVIRMSLVAALFLLCGPAVLAQTAVDPTGHWEGSVHAPTAEVKFAIDLTKNSQGELEGTFDQPEQNLKGLGLSSFAVKGTSIRFQIKGAPGERAFEGVLGADGKSMSGDFTQGGYAMPFSLTRTGDARIEARARSVPIGKDLEGTWNGTLEVNGMQRRLVLKLSNQADAATGTILSVEEGLEIPITTITQNASSLTLVMQAIGGSYSGTLNQEHTELAGTLTQGPASVPLTFRLSKP
jgi:hypothetical protein